MRAWHDRINDARAAEGHDVEIFALERNPGAREVFYFPELDRLWKRGDPALMRMYERLATKLADKDVLVHFNGANLHPEFVAQLGVLKVYHCADDPEATDILSKPVAHAYDLHAVSNVSELDRYRGWGLQNVFFHPLGSFSLLSDTQDVSEGAIRDAATRDVPIVFFGTNTGVVKSGMWNRMRGASYRHERMSALARAFPEAFVAGGGWTRGFVSDEEMWKTYRRARLGWNVHNSTGPINFRTYDLASMGVMQICDNPSGLAQIYELGKEAVGFSSIDECIELTRHYLACPEEAAEIAVGGWRRWRSDYHPIKVWESLEERIERALVERQAPPRVDPYEIRLNLAARQHKARAVRWVGELIERPLSILKRLMKRMLHR